MLALHKRLSYKQAKWALLLLSFLSLTVSIFQIFSDWKEERVNIQHQVMSTLYIVESAATEAAYILDGDFSRKIITGLMRSNDFYKIRLENEDGDELASVSRPLATLSSSWLSEQVFSGLPESFHLTLKHHSYLDLGQAMKVGELIVYIDNGVVKNSFIQRNVRLIITSVLSALLFGFAVFILFYVQISRPLSRLTEQLSVLEKEDDHSDELQFKQSIREDELGVLSRTISALWHKRKKVENELAKSEAYFKAVLHQSSESMLLTDLSGKILDNNDQTCHLLGYSSLTLKTLNIEDIDIEQTPDALRNWSLSEQRESKTFETQYRRHTGEHFPVEVCGSIITLNEDNYFLASFRDITDRKKDQERVRFLAYNDVLTGLPNRRFLNENLEGIINTARENSDVGGLLFVDLDRFKSINDSMGHHIGDALLVEVAKRIIPCLPESGIATRIGGDEFVLLIPSLADNVHEAQQSATHLAVTLLSELSQAFRLEETDLFISASIGIRLFPSDKENDVDVLHQADSAMYEAKESGRNSFRFYNQEVQQKLDEKLILERALQVAIENNELSLVYQPQIDENGCLIGFETLLRWNSAVLGQVPPDRFIPVAEDVGTIDEIGSWVLDNACKQLKEWQDLGLPPSFQGLAINISPYQFSKDNFVETVKEIIASHQVDPTLLDLEITEGMLVGNIPSVADKMWQLKKEGIRFSIDDFGTGYSSLRYLQHFPLYQLKVDKSFVRDLSSDPNSHVIVNTIVSMANHMDLSVLVEGVESKEDKIMVEQLGCFRYQGYYFSKPLEESMASQCLHEDIRFPLISHL